MKFNKNKLIVFIFLILSFSFFSCKSKKTAYEEGYAKGIYEGKNTAIADCEAKLKERESENSKIYQNKKNEYERLLIEAYDIAYKEGQDSMQKDLDETITVTTTTKKKKRKSEKK